MVISADRRRSRAPIVALAAVLLAAIGCTPDAAPRSKDKAQDFRAQVTAAAAVQPAVLETKPPRTSGQMQRDAIAAEGAAASTPATTPISARRCGWLTNPTPGNWWLFDGHGEWILATQGSEPTPGFDDLPDMSTAGWVETNGHYGYGCACMTLSYDPVSHRGTRIAGARPKPLKQCRADRSLPRP